MAKKKPPKQRIKTSVKNELFCQYYTALNEDTFMNGQESATEAGWAERTARVTASKLLTNPNIIARIKEIVNKRAESIDYSAERVLQEVAKIALANIKVLFDESGSLKQIHELTDDEAALLSSVEVDSLFDGSTGGKDVIGTTKKVKLWDKVRSLEMLMKYHKLFELDNKTPNNEEPCSEEFL